MWYEWWGEIFSENIPGLLLVGFRTVLYVVLLEMLDLNVRRP